MPHAHALALCLLVTLAPPILADDVDSEQNPVSGHIETIRTVWNGTDRDLYLTIDREALSPLSYEIVSGATDDADPSIAIDDEGTTWFAWTRNASNDEVYVGTRLDDGTLGAARLVSDPSENSRSPRIAGDGVTTRLVYEIAYAGTKKVAVAVIDDEPDPIGTRTIVATTTWPGAIDPRIHVEAGHTWVTFVYDDDDLGWSELSGGSWSALQFERYEVDDFDAARAVIRQNVVSQ